MYKTSYSLRCLLGKSTVKIMMYMKLTLLFLIMTTFYVSANGLAQTVTLNAKSQSLKSIFHEIRKQTGKDFLYNSNLVNNLQKADLHVSNVDWKKALEILLKPNGLQYKTNGNTVLIFPLEDSLSKVPESKQQQIRGFVRNSEQQPVAGATVTLVADGRKVATDETGQFVFNNAEPIGEISISIIGYHTLVVSYSNGIIPEIFLQSTTQAIDELVVVGYGKQTKKELLGSVSQVNGDQLAKRAVPQLSQALTGQMPGVSVIQRSGQPGSSGGTIQIRGIGSFGAGTEALILVDGIPTNSFNNIDPNDVESVSVLKDASSAAIYGARAANGVILVTTKSGSTQNKLSINYNGYVGLQTPTAYSEFVDSWEYATAINESTTGGGGYSQEEIQKFKDGSDPDNYPNSNFFDEFFKSSSRQTGHSINLSNSTEKVQYAFSLGYMNQDGIVRKNNFNRYNTRLNLTTSIRDNLKLSTRLSATQTSDDQPAAPSTLDFADMNSIISQVIRYPAIYAIRMENGDWGPGNNLKGNPISFLESDSFYKARGMDLSGNIRLDWTIIPELTVSAIGGYRQGNTRTKLFRATQRINDNIILFPSTLNQASPYNNYKTFQALADYRKSINKHNLKFLAGYSFEMGYNEGLSAFRQNFPSNDLTELNIGSPDGQQNTGTASEWGLESLFGRLQYNYAERYLLEGVVRYDGSSRFTTTQKYAIFPSVAAGWLISEESFLKGKVNWLNMLKVKASYGILGNQNIGNYPYQNILNTGSNYPFGNTIKPGVNRQTLMDPNLRWESTRTSDIGLEANLFNNKLNFTATYYDRNTYDILVSPQASVSAVLGFDVGLQNSGKLKNSGFEFTLGHQNKVKDWSYNINLNYSTVSNEVIDLGVGNVPQPNGLVGNGSLFIGYPIQLYYGYKTDGLFVDQQDVDSWHDMSAINPKPQPGDIRYMDISGPNGVPDGIVDPNYDRTLLGSRIPKHNLGLNLGVNYKNFDLSVLVQGVTGVKGYLENYAGFALHGNGNIQRWQYDGRWTAENPDRNAQHPRIEQLSVRSPNTLLSDYWLLDASYIRLKNLQLSYSLPKSVINSWGIDGLRVNVSAENLYTWDNYRKGWDPEINSDGNYYPIMRNFTFGVNLTF